MEVVYVWEGLSLAGGGAITLPLPSDDRSEAE